MMNLRNGLLALCSWLLVVTAAAAAADGAYTYRVKVTHGAIGTSAVTTARGTAFALDKHNLLTAFHVIEDGGEYSIEVGAEWIPVTIAKCDEGFDIAMLHSARALPAFTALVKTNELDGEAKVYGSPEGEKIKCYTGEISPRSIGIKNLLWVKIANGCSGAPVVQADQVIGIILAMTFDDHMAVFLPARRIRQFLAEPIVDK